MSWNMFGMQVAVQRLEITVGETVSRTVQRDGRGVANSGPNSYDGARRNTLKTVLIVVIMYWICWTPNELLWGLQYFGVVAVDFESWTFRLSVMAQFSYCYINPLIYSIKYKDFRQGFARMMKKILPSQLLRLILSFSSKVDVSTTGTRSNTVTTNLHSRVQL
jgi:7 transmembrane receptor (rhodopsin family)